jgi:predicted ester cyclase
VTQGLPGAERMNGGRVTMMTPAEMCRIDESVREAMSAGDVDAFDELMAPELAAEFRETIQWLKQGFPDYGGENVMRIVDEEKQMTATRFVYHGTHEGEIYGVPPTGKKITFQGLALNRYANGKMVESIVELDRLDVLRQMGASGLPSEA